MTALLVGMLLFAGAGAGCDPDNPALVTQYRALDISDASFHPLGRQAILTGLTEIDVRLDDSCSERYGLRWFAVSIGAEPLCMVNGPEDSCVVDFGGDMNSWTLTVKTSISDSKTSSITRSERMLSTLDVGLDSSATRHARSGTGVALQERTAADQTPYDDIWRTALVLDRKGVARTNLTASDFMFSVSGVGGEELVDAWPLAEVNEKRLLFILLDVSDYITLGKADPVWRPEYISFADAIVQSLGTVVGPGRMLLLVRYAGSAESSPLVTLDAEGIQTLSGWLQTPPLASWRRHQADRTAVLLQTYDLHLHDFDGQPLGLIVAGGRNTHSEPSALLAEQRLDELNPLWNDEKLSAIIAELDAGLANLFPHAEQRGFPLSWVNVPSTRELTRDKFAKGSGYFYRFGGEVYRLASIRDIGKSRGHRATGGTLFLADILKELFENLESSYLLHLRIPNPWQKRTERRIMLGVAGSTVKTQEFYRPSESLSANIVRYIRSSSKERRFRAAYAARGYPLDKRIYGQISAWLEQEPSSQVRPILEESKLLMDFKRTQAADKSVRSSACEQLLGTDPATLAQGNKSLHQRLSRLAAANSCAEKDRFFGPELDMQSR